MQYFLNADGCPTCMIGNCMEKEPRGVVALFRTVGVGAGLARISSESFVDCVLTRIEKVTPFSRLTGSGVNVEPDGVMESRAPQIHGITQIPDIGPDCHIYR